VNSDQSTVNSAGYGLRDTRYGLRDTGCGLRDTGCGGAKFTVYGSTFRVVHWRAKVESLLAGKPLNHASAFSDIAAS
jgi:hypothetical protein